MDINDVRGILTAIIFFAFVGIWAWAWSARRKKDFEASAALPLEEDNYITDNEREGREARQLTTRAGRSETVQFSGEKRCFPFRERSSPSPYALSQATGNSPCRW